VKSFICVGHLILCDMGNSQINDPKKYLICFSKIAYNSKSTSSSVHEHVQSDCELVYKPEARVELCVCKKTQERLK